MDNEKYKEALERAKSAIKECGNNQGRIAMIESIFPELKESEDKRIIKILQNIVKGACSKYGIKWRGVETSEEDLLAWLEKQGETFTKKDVDDAYLKGVCDAKHELEKQGESK